MPPRRRKDAKPSSSAAAFRGPGSDGRRLENFLHQLPADLYINIIELLSPLAAVRLSQASHKDREATAHSRAKHVQQRLKLVDKELRALRARKLKLESIDTRGHARSLHRKMATLTDTLCTFRTGIGDTGER